VVAYTQGVAGSAETTSGFFPGSVAVGGLSVKLRLQVKCNCSLSSDVKIRNKIFSQSTTVNSAPTFTYRLCNNASEP